MMKRTDPVYRHKDKTDQVIDEVVLIEVLIKDLGIDLPPNRTVLCPFHQDQTPSAKLYADNTLYCFTEARQYSSSDFLKHLYSDKEYRNVRREIEKRYDIEKYTVKTREFLRISNLQDLKEFKTGSISIEEVFQRVPGLMFE